MNIVLFGFISFLFILFLLWVEQTGSHHLKTRRRTLSKHKQKEIKLINNELTVLKSLLIISITVVISTILYSISFPIMGYIRG